MLVKSLFLTVLLLTLTAANAAGSNVTLNIKDDIPKFLNFYREATAQQLTEPARWDRWKQDYGIAAVPPTPQGRKLARKQLDAAWPRYAALVSNLAGQSSEVEAIARKTLPRVAALLDPEGTTSVAVDLVLFVGEFDGNAYTAPRPGEPPVVVVPVEDPRVSLKLAHEFTHAVHMQIGHLKNGFGAPLGQTILMEGLAMHAAAAIVPGHDPQYYVSSAIRGPGWLKACRRKWTAVFKGVIPFLHDADRATATRFTYGKGTTGLTSEAYCVGWLLVGDLLDQGKTFAELARVPEADMPDYIKKAIEAELAGDGVADF